MTDNFEGHAGLDKKKQICEVKRENGNSKVVESEAAYINNVMGAQPGIIHHISLYAIQIKSCENSDPRFYIPVTPLSGIVFTGKY